MRDIRYTLWRLVLISALAGCAVPEPPSAPPQRPEEVRSQIVALMPDGVRDRAGWAVDIYAAFSALGIGHSTSKLCAALSIAEQESSFRVDPAVPRLGQIAKDEIDRRATSAGVPTLLVHAALQLRSSDGRSYSERLDAVKTEKELSELFEDLIGAVPLGRRLFAGYNPVRTGGPMQVSIAFAERHTMARPYPYPISATVRREVFTRRGGLYFGIAHLLDYPANYDEMIYRFADFNAGRYASRNAAFQNAVSLASGIPLDLDGDVVRLGGNTSEPGATETAVRALGARLSLSEGEMRKALEGGATYDFERTQLYRAVFELAEQTERRRLPRAMLPRILLTSPKITRPLTTDWFAHRVDERYQRCIARASRASHALVAAHNRLGD